jgi:hypothetical protein
MNRKKALLLLVAVALVSSIAGGLWYLTRDEKFDSRVEKPDGWFYGPEGMSLAYRQDEDKRVRLWLVNESGQKVTDAVCQLGFEWERSSVLVKEPMSCWEEFWVDSNMVNQGYLANIYFEVQPEGRTPAGSFTFNISRLFDIPLWRQGKYGLSDKEIMIVGEYEVTINTYRKDGEGVVFTEIWATNPKFEQPWLVTSVGDIPFGYETKFGYLLTMTASVWQLEGEAWLLADLSRPNSVQFTANHPFEG